MDFSLLQFFWLLDPFCIMMIHVGYMYIPFLGVATEKDRHDEEK